MTTIDRRTLLAVAAGCSVGLAGCLDGGLDPGDDNEEPAGGNGPNGEADGLEAYTIEYYSHTDVVEEPHLELFLDAESAMEAVETRPYGEEGAADLETLVGETDFERAVIVDVAGLSPDLCHDLTVTAIGLEQAQRTDEDDERRIAVDAAVVSYDVDVDACAQQVITVGAFIRVVFTDERVTRASLSYTDSQGDSSEVGVGVDEVTEGS